MHLIGKKMSDTNQIGIPGRNQQPGLSMLNLPGFIFISEGLGTIGKEVDNGFSATAVFNESINRRINKNILRISDEFYWIIIHAKYGIKMMQLWFEKLLSSLILLKICFYPKKNTRCSIELTDGCSGLSLKIATHN
jgi:hypothetical protein